MHRFDFKKTIPALLLGMMLFIFSYTLPAQDLEIHYLNVQQGQSTLIIGPDGTTILYDGGNEFKGTTEVVPYLQGIGIPTTQALNYIIVSHRDTDHYMGLTEVINYGYDALNIYDNGSDKYNPFVQSFLDAAATTTAGGVIPIPLGTVINLGNGATATCVAVNGSVIGTGAVPGGQANENDRSVCLLIKYGNFEYLVTGDMGGGSDDFACTGRSTTQVNIETPLVRAIMPAGIHPLLSQYGVEIAHVGHHGSESSTNPDYMNTLTPTVACISVGAGQGIDWFHPRIDVVENVLLAQAPCITAPPALILQTEEGDPSGYKTSFAGYCVGDIVISTDGINSYTVSANGAVSQGPDERTTAGLPGIYYFDEYIAADNPPIVYNIHDENGSRTSVDIVWSTNEPATSIIRYGTTTGSYPNTAGNTTLAVNHRVTLSNLTAFTTYYYIVESTDATNNTTTSQEYTFLAVNAEDIKVVFSEVFYDTPGTDTVEEWIELYNNSPVTVDISGWKIIDNNGSGSTFTIPAGTLIAPGTYYTIAVDSTGFMALYGYDADQYGAIPSMNNDGDVLVLKNKSGTIIDAVAWEGGSTGGLPAGWGSTTDPSAATGYTIVRPGPTADTDTYADWSTDDGNGYPQTQFMNNPDQMKVIFSEIFYDTPGTDSVEEWIELYNNSPMTVDISGWTITDNNGTGATFTIPSGKSIAPHTYYTIAVNSAGFNALYGYNADLYGAIPSLNNDGDALILKNNYGTVKDAVAWEGGATAGVPTGWGSTTAPNAAMGETIIRTDVTVDTDTYSDWSKLSSNGFPQTQALTYRVVFSEVLYDTPGTDTVEEWIELYNNSPITVNIGGWKITDNNGSGASFTIPDGKTIAPGTFYTIAVDSAGFNALYGYNADLYGLIPALNNDGDALILQDKYSNTIDAVAWEGGATAGVPTGWGSASLPAATTGSTIVRTDKTVDTGTYSDWSTAANNGTPQTQSQGSSGTIKVVFSEIFYDTPGTETKEEWIELHNNSSQAVDISGWKITDNNNTGTTFTIPTGQTIAAGAYYTIAINGSGFSKLYGYSPNLVGTIPSLNNDGDALVLKDSSNTVKDAVGWEAGASAGLPAGWGSTSLPNAPESYSIVRTYVATDTDTYADWSTAPNNGNPQIQ
ncbi:MAG TPA: lamin tail domain-containing protein [Candidatus Deferrimicrobium sp.]|nr:lamin tail domain-containing protein [Candidatus Deferrimicrobium sp.]